MNQSVFTETFFCSGGVRIFRIVHRGIKTFHVWICIYVSWYKNRFTRNYECSFFSPSFSFSRFRTVMFFFSFGFMELKLKCHNDRLRVFFWKKINMHNLTLFLSSFAYNVFISEMLEIIQKHIWKQNKTKESSILN